MNSFSQAYFVNLALKRGFEQWLSAFYKGIRGGTKLRIVQGREAPAVQSRFYE